MALLAAGLAVLAALLGYLLYRSHGNLAANRQASVNAERELQLVADLTARITDTDFQRSIQELAGALVGSGVCRAALLVSLADSGSLEIRSSAHAPGESPWDPAGDVAVGQALETAARMDTPAGNRYLPIVVDGEAVGLLALRRPTGGHTAQSVAAKLAGLGLMALKRQQRQMALSNTDGLTGLANHRHFQQLLGVALGQAYLQGEPLSIILLDIDHFKSVNDTYGHLLGDLVLREIGYLLRRELPPDALPARYGGEEMVVLLQGESARRAAEIAESFRQVVAGHQVLDFNSGARFSVTVSLGVAAYELGQGKSRLIARADEALYTSKRDGRNRVTVASPSGLESDLSTS